jgi:hypothetical protein
MRTRPISIVLLLIGVGGGLILGIAYVVIFLAIPFSIESGAHPSYYDPSLAIGISVVVGALIGAVWGTLCAAGALLFRVVVRALNRSRIAETVAVGLGSFAGAAAGYYLLATLSPYNAVAFISVVGGVASLVFCVITARRQTPVAAA